MNDEYTYRKGKLSDLKHLQSLGLKAYGQFESVLGEEEWKKMAAGCGAENTYLNLLNIAQCFVCVKKEMIIGMAFLIPKGNPFSFFEAGWSYIRLVGVDPDFEGQGIGKTLTQQCIQFAKESGEKIVALHTSEFQNAARHIYESLGFKRLRELEPIFNKKYFLYTLNLNNEENKPSLK